MRRRVLAVVLLTTVSGCASAPEPPFHDPVTRSAPTYAEGFRDGIAAGRRRERQEIVSAFDHNVTPAIIRHCDISESWLNEHGPIPLKRMARAREREMQLKLACARKMKAARRAYANQLWILRRE